MQPHGLDLGISQLEKSTPGTFSNLCCVLSSSCLLKEDLSELCFPMLVGDGSSPPGTRKEDLVLDAVFSSGFQQDELSHITAQAREEQHVKHSSFWGQVRSKCLRSWEPPALPWALSGDAVTEPLSGDAVIECPRPTRAAQGASAAKNWSQVSSLRFWPLW